MVNFVNNKHMVLQNDNANGLYRSIIKNVNEWPDFTPSPRGTSILEKINLTAVLTNPLNCLVTISERKLNYRFAAIEKLEYLYGKHDLDRLSAYNSNMSHYGGIYNYSDGNYAQRLNFWLDHVYNLLRKDPDSRQAVVSIYDGSARHQSLDIPCTLTLQFLLRKRKLNLITNMRSNDLLYGFPYDINAFCFLQQVMASWLGVELGSYFHNAGSMHIYTEPQTNYNMLIATKNSTTTVGVKNPVWNLSYEETKEWLPKFFYMEERMRRLKKLEPDYLPPQLDEYLKLLSTKFTNKFIE